MSTSDIETLSRRSYNVVLLGIIGSLVMNVMIRPYIRAIWSSERDHVPSWITLHLKEITILTSSATAFFCVCIVIGTVSLIVSRYAHARVSAKSPSS